MTIIRGIIRLIIMKIIKVLIKGTIGEIIR
jgi:hypothetical protein